MLNAARFTQALKDRNQVHEEIEKAALKAAQNGIDQFSISLARSKALDVYCQNNGFTIVYNHGKDGVTIRSNEHYRELAKFTNLVERKVESMATKAVNEGKDSIYLKVHREEKDKIDYLFGLIEVWGFKRSYDEKTETLTVSF